MPPRRRRSVRQPCVVCNSYLHPATQQEPDVSCDGCSQPPPLGIGHNKAPVAHIDCLLGPDDDARKGMLVDQDDHGVTTWLCQTCCRRTMEPEGVAVPGPAPPAAVPPVAPPPMLPLAAPKPLQLAPPPADAAPEPSPLPDSVPAAVDASCPDDCVCPITQELMADPYVCADGHSYEHDAIVAWLERHDTSPRTNEPLAYKQLVPNITLRNAISAFRSRTEVPAPAPASQPVVPRSRSRSRGRRRRGSRRRRSRSRSRRKSRGSRRRRSRSRSRKRPVQAQGGSGWGAPAAKPGGWGLPAPAAAGWSSPLANPALGGWGALPAQAPRSRSRSRGRRRNRSRSR